MTETALTYANLKDIDDVTPLDQSDLDFFEDIKKLLSKHNKLSRFGICLLHSHFEMKHNEVLVEHCDHENRQLVCLPQISKDLQDSMIQETSWRFDQPEAAQVCFKTCVANGTTGTHRKSHVQGA